MRWTVHSEKPLYTDPWIDVRAADVELPDGHRFDHRLIRRPPGAGAVVLDGRGRALLLWRHRFITDTWGYEIPMGGVHPGESPERAAAREVLEETGWRPGPLRPLVYVQPSSGLTDSEHRVFVADTAERVGEPQDAWEAERVEWVALDRVPELIRRRQLVSGTSMNALLYLYATGRD
ncbi:MULTISPECIES: NUDIX hydrolase [Nocardiopsis]|uniref:NUDIX hydrolase n=1 Tax=Nocardiopsis dassonvillei (strain ATCC 23218 / DSM 43111 / CIP 107115 / JCM 7437 / KCTC 9190 / NBRC 14626 / NCTC 10488 / NRRL B-5397 / IMRU 509) TaxID=446468 RepID=D7AUJ5_NOCDD|nr:MULTISPECIES: NUDIX hydrolase [Nocardiopsis]ADH67575.1 NUDIX hydrolase [Nocardiopsis dassonvillei subsp. dassonvillei DSM 43111]APC35764.1 NUDIX hydrolase [Nocardiopsis dassonvillei]NKY77587.1 NUDIX hydrolase [Nocardiopsis dassonvillei]VEI87909.1 ADP-ribose pyrophosphatase [Nocardiopsis dassonvillei]